jgi:predicted nuclease of predicted toxin-antitoxin system
MRFLLDENVSWRLAKLLSPDFGDVLHVNQTPLGESSEDRDIRHFALKENRCIITNDDDFHTLSAYYGYPPKVILLKMGNQSTLFIAKILLSKTEDISRFLDNEDYGVLEIL